MISQEQACPICSESFKLDNRWGYLEDGVRHPTCERCHAALMNIVLYQKLGRIRSRKDPRQILRQELGIKA